MNTKYLVELNNEQRQNLEKITSSGAHPARKIKRAQILWAGLSQGLKDLTLWAE